MNESQVVAGLGALAQEDRLRIVRYLVRQGADGANAGAIAAALEIAPSRLSFHMAALEKGALVAKSRQSRNIIYVAQFTQLAALSGFLFEECCADQTDAPGCCP